MSKRAAIAATALLVTALVAVVLLDPVLSQSRVNGNAGTRVTSTSGDFKPTIVVPARTAYLARNVLGGNAQDDTIFIHWGAGASGDKFAVGDIRIKGGTFGGYVAPGDVELNHVIKNLDGTNAPLTTTVVGNVAFLETDGVPGYSRGDMVYADWTGGATGTCTASVGALSVCDVRLSTLTLPLSGGSFSAGTGVAASEQDLTRAGSADGTYPDSTALTALPAGSLLWFDANGDGTEGAGDGFYLRGTTGSFAPQSAGFTPQPGDLRLVAYGGFSAGTKVAAGDSDSLRHFFPGNVASGAVGASNFATGGLNCVALVTDGSTDPAGYKLFLHYDRNNDCTLNADEPNTIGMNDKILYFSGQTAGTLVSSAATGYGKAITSLVPFEANLLYCEQDGNGAFTTGDAVYWDRPATAGTPSVAWGASAGETGVVSRYDLRITSSPTGSFTAGTLVVAGNADATACGAGAVTTGGFVSKLSNPSQSRQVPLQTLSNAKVSGANDAWASATESVYISSDAAVSTGDIRVFSHFTSGTTYAAGSTVNCSTPDRDCPTGTDPAGTLVALANAKVTGPDGTWNPDVREHVYISADAIVNAPDTRVTALATGTPGDCGVFATASDVAAGDCDTLGSPLQSGELLLVGRTALGTASIPMVTDVKLSGTFGERYLVTSTETVPFLKVPAATSWKIGRSNRGESTQLLDDVLSISQSSSTSYVAGDVRLVPTPSTTLLAGSQAKSGDSDFGDVISVNDCGASGFVACVGWVNVVGSAGSYDLDDLYYLDTNILGFGSAGFSAYDVRLNDFTMGGTALRAGTFVLPGNADLNAFSGTALAAPASRTLRLKYFDANNNNLYDTGDSLYLSGDPGTNFIPLRGDVRLVGPSGVAASTTTAAGGITTTASTAPTLSGASINQMCILPSGSLTMSVTYTDSQNRAPSASNVVFNGVTTSMAGSGTYSSGVTYTATVTAPSAPGDYAPTFNFANAGGTVSLGGPTVTVMSSTPAAPTLSSGSVSPPSGAPGATFTWTVTYRDLNNDAPTVKQVLVNGIAKNMTSSDTTYCNGATFSYSQTLGAGEHTYAFKFKDASTEVMLPTTGSVVGPTISDETATTTPTTSATQDTQTTTPTTSEGGSPGFEAFVVLIAFLGAMLWIRRR